MLDGQRVVIGLGSNLGDKIEVLAAAVNALTGTTRPILTQVRVSELVESPALLPDNAPKSWDIPFYNLAISGYTTLEPRHLLCELKRIEEQLGRVERERWAPREIDIDILCWESMVVDEPDLNIPHNQLLNRHFALWPLVAVEPDLFYPVPGSCYGDCFKDLVSRWSYRVRESGARFTSAVSQPEQKRFFNLLDSSLSRRRLPYDGPQLVGILNITPDSFSDGGMNLDTESAVRSALEMFKSGATVIDIGAESTRPGGGGVSEDEEWNRLEPVLAALDREFKDTRHKPLISVDTRRAEVATKALGYSIDWLNDVGGFCDPEMIKVASNSDLTLVMMHSLEVPPSKSTVLPSDCDPLLYLSKWANNQIAILEEFGISRERVIFDPGIGFGKMPSQSLAIINKLARFKELDLRVLVGHSRKSFLSLFTDKSFEDRDFETSILSLRCTQGEVNYLRVHNVSLNAQALTLAAS